MHWQIQTRHSPCVVKRATLEAASEDEALKKFVELNIRRAQERHAKNWKVVVRSIEEWMRGGGLDEVDIAEVAAPAPPVAPPADAEDPDAEASPANDAAHPEPVASPAKKKRPRRKVPTIAHPEPVTVTDGSGEDETEELKFVV